jgi:hypothetical protein
VVLRIVKPDLFYIMAPGRTDFFSTPRRYDANKKVNLGKHSLAGNHRQGGGPAYAWRHGHNPMVIRSIMPMVSCEEIIIRGNLFLPKYDKRIWPLITDGCATEIREFQEVCVLVTNYEDDDCQVITDNLLSHHYTDIVNDVIKEDRGL